MNIKSISSLIGNTPLVRLERLNKTNNQLYVKLEIIQLAQLRIELL